ncbi:arf-GAP with GTPase, ANK repeat and PH domain-containing protein 1-like isoform X1 [Styela clava]
MRIMESYKQEFKNSTAIRQEIVRFESVHPSIYAIYELVQRINNQELQSQIRDHVLNVEDAFVNSQEWTLGKNVPEIRLGVVGSLNSGKSALVHRYLTGTYVQDEAPEGGRFKKEVTVGGQSSLLLVRNEGGVPDAQFAAWVDAIVFVFNLSDEASFQSIYNLRQRLSQHRDFTNVPIVLVGTQDSMSPSCPRVIFNDRAMQLASDFKRCSYYETCATYGLNVDRVFQDAAQKVISHRKRPEPHMLSHVSSGSLSTPGTPLHRSMSTSSAYHENGGLLNSNFLRDYLSPDSMLGLITPTPFRKSGRRKSNLFSGRKSSDSEEKRKNKEQQMQEMIKDVGFGRNIPIKQGWLHKRSKKPKLSNREWKKRYVTLSNEGILTYFNSMHDYMENVHGKSISVVKTTVKVPGRLSYVPSKSTPSKDKNSEDFEFHLVSMDGNIWYFSCPTSYERDQWVLVIEQQIMNVLQNGASSKNKTDCTMMTPVDMEVFRSIPGNDTCVDCDCPNPTWASLNLGCMMCIQCSGIHRNLGSHVSRVRSIELDDWPIECSAVMKQVGNRVCNSVYEANVGRFIKPTPHSTREEREVFIRDKYIHKKFVSSLPAECDVGATICEAISSANMRLLVQMLSHATPSDINAPATRDHRAALHIAAYHGDLAMLQLLLWNKADVRQRTATGETAAMITEHRGHQECHRVLSSSVPHDRLSVLHDQANNSPASLTSSASSLSIATLPSENALIPAVNHDHGYYSNEMNTRPNINYMYTSAI